MNKLIEQLQRLYFLPGQLGRRQKIDGNEQPSYRAAETLSPELLARSLAGESSLALGLVGPDSMARTLVIDFCRASDWETVAKLYQGVQHDLELPPPALSISGKNGYQLWLSLAEAIPLTTARNFLDALRQRYLTEIPLTKLGFHPAADASAPPGPINLVPAVHPLSGKWSAFIDPNMGGMFVDEPGLEMAPNMDRQADILARLHSIKAADFHHALAILQTPAATETVATEASPNNEKPASEYLRSTLKVDSNFTDPKSFLLAVMNDATATPALRVEAAKALLPYFGDSQAS